MSCSGETATHLFIFELHIESNTNTQHIIILFTPRNATKKKGSITDQRASSDQFNAAKRSDITQ